MSKTLTRDKGPKEGFIKVDPRAMFLSAKDAMQGDIGLAIVELVTNSDDSYDRLGITDRSILITYHKKQKYRTMFTVRDDAEGQSIEDFHRNFTHYCKAGDLKDSNSTRGYFGKGAKDALICMEDGRIASFKDGRFIECTLLFDENHKPKYKILKDCRIDGDLRKKYGISKNGTVASFWASSQGDRKITVPQFGTLQSDLSNHYLLRKILQDEKTTVTLVDLAKKKASRRRLKYISPKGAKHIAEQFLMTYGKYPPFVVDITVCSSDNPISQREKGNTRQGGILVIDDKDIVLDLSLFKFDGNDFASRCYGEVVVHGFRKLLEDNEVVLSPKRDGLVKNHQFNIELISEIEKRIAKVVQINKDNLSRFDVCEAGQEYRKRHHAFNKLLNEIARNYLGREEAEIEEETKDMVYPNNGFEFRQISANITIDKHKVLFLRIDTEEVPPGTVVSIRSTNPTIKIQNANSKLVVPNPKKKGIKIVRKAITAIGTVPHESGKIIAKVSDREAKAPIYITPPKDISPYGLAFGSNTATTPPNKVKKIYLLADANIISSGDVIKIKSYNPNIHISPKKIVVNEVTDATRGIMRYELEVWGQGLGEEGDVLAVVAKGEWDAEAILGVTIKEKADSKSKSSDDIFKPCEMRMDPHPPQPCSFNREAGTVVIYAKFPTVKYYVGEHLEFRETLPARQMIAHLVIEKYFYQLALRGINSRGSIDPTTKHDAVQSDANELMLTYGGEVLKLLVDQDLVKKSRKDKDD